jgi:hypothetical protein
MIREMISVRARVRNGRLVVDEPTDLPDGTELDLVELAVPDEEIVARLRASPRSDEPLSAEEAAELAAIGARGKFTSHEEVKRRLAKKA